MSAMQAMTSVTTSAASAMEMMMAMAVQSFSAAGPVRLARREALAETGDAGRALAVVWVGVAFLDLVGDDAHRGSFPVWSSALVVVCMLTSPFRVLGSRGRWMTWCR